MKIDQEQEAVSERCRLILLEPVVARHDRLVALYHEGFPLRISCSVVAARLGQEIAAYEQEAQVVQGVL